MVDQSRGSVKKVLDAIFHQNIEDEKPTALK